MSYWQIGVCRIPGHCEEGEARRGNPLQNMESPADFQEIATPVCGLVRNDPLFSTDRQTEIAVPYFLRSLPAKYFFIGTYKTPASSMASSILGII